MKNLVLIIALTATSLFAISAHAVAASDETKLALYKSLAISGVEAEVPFAGARSYEAYDVSCQVDPLKDGAVTCELYDLPKKAHGHHRLLLNGKRADFLFETLLSLPETKGETGAATEYIRCSKTVYGTVTDLECKVSL